MPKDVIDSAIEQALHEADEQGIHGKASTPFLLARVCVNLVGGDSLNNNIQLVLNNARLASAIAKAIALKRVIKQMNNALPMVGIIFSSSVIFLSLQNDHPLIVFSRASPIGCRLRI